MRYERREERELRRGKSGERKNGREGGGVKGVGREGNSEEKKK